MLSSFMVWEIKGATVLGEKKKKREKEKLEISEMRGEQSKECWEETKTTSSTDIPHQQMHFLFLGDIPDDALNYILGVEKKDFSHKCR